MHRRLSPNNPVRRRIEIKSEEGEGQNDNRVNSTKELLEKENELMKKKWNYDFDNDAPLTGTGKVNWRYQNEEGHWIGVIQNDDETDEMENKTVEVEPENVEAKVEDVIQNEVTPNPTPIKEVTNPPVRKRSRMDDSPTDNYAKKKIL